MGGKISKYLLRSICLFVEVLVVSESLWVCSYEEKEDRTNIKANAVLTYLDYPTGKLYTYNSEGTKKLNNPAIAFFFGGGWNSGSPKQFEPQTRYLTRYGITVVLADYRTKDNAGTTPKEVLMDAKSAIRFLKKNATPLCIDPEKVLAGGGSAGGHLAAATAFCGNISHPKDDLSVSSVPKALILFNPVVDNSLEGYGFNGVKDYYEDFPPIHSIKKNAPPTIFFLGTEDNIISVETTQKFKKKMEAVGARCDLFLYTGQKHGFFNSQHKEYFEKTMVKTVTFSKSLGYIGD